MKKYLLPLSCLFLGSACQHVGNTPDWTPAKDLPAGTYVRITLQDANKPQRRSTYLVDPRTDTVVERLDGKRAVVASEAQAFDAASTGEVSQAATPATHNVSMAITVDCRDTRATPEGCLDLAIDPKHETAGDPNPIKDERLRIAATERYVRQLAVNALQTAHRAGVKVHVPAARRIAK